MLAKAIYDHGTLRFVSPLHLKSERMELEVVIPDDQIAPKRPASDRLSSDLQALAKEDSLLAEVWTILGDIGAYVDSPPLTARQSERLTAVQPREDW